MAQRTVTNYSDLLAAFNTLSGGGKVIFKDGFELPEGQVAMLPEGDWQFIGQNDEVNISILGTISVLNDSTLSIQTGHWNFGNTGKLEAAEDGKPVDIKAGTTISADDSQIVGPHSIDESVQRIQSEGVEPSEQVSETEDVSAPEADSDPTDPEPVEDEPSEDSATNEEPEVESESEPEVEKELEVEEGPKATETPSEDKGDIAPSASGTSKRVKNVQVHLGPSKRSRSNSFTGAVTVFGSTVDAFGHTWCKVKYKLPGSGKPAVGYVLESKIK